MGEINTTKTKRRRFHRPQEQKSISRKRRPRRRGKGPLESLFRNYERLREEMVEAREKYFSCFHGTNFKKKIHQEKRFLNTINKFYEFEKILSPEDRQKFEKLFPSLKEDRGYSERRGLPPEGEKPSKEEGEDPHFLESQKETAGSWDDEESEGGLDDYLRVKGKEISSPE